MATPRLEHAKQLLQLNNRQLAAELRITEEWLSKVLNGHRSASADLMLRLDDLLRRRGIDPSSFKHLNLGANAQGVEEPQGLYPSPVATRIPLRREPSTRADCEAYVQRLLDAADLGDNPNAFPVIFDRLQKQFPLDEWAPPPEPNSPPHEK